MGWENWRSVFLAENWTTFFLESPNLLWQSCFDLSVVDAARSTEECIGLYDRNVINLLWRTIRKMSKFDHSLTISDGSKYVLRQVAWIGYPLVPGVS